MSDIDHKAEAIEWAKRASNPDATKTLTYSGVAQVHATLYAAEQQRIANIIAFTSRSGYTPTEATLRLIEKGLGI